MLGLFSKFDRIFLIFGLLFMAISLYQLYVKFDLYMHGTRVQASVTALDTSTSRDSKGRSNTIYRTVVEFTDAQGNHQRLVDRIGSNVPAYAVNQRVSIAYDSDSPQNFFILSGFPISFELMFLGAGIITVWIGWPRKRYPALALPNFSLRDVLTANGKGMDKLQALAMQTFVQRIQASGMKVESIEAMKDNASDIEPPPQQTTSQIEKL